MVRENIYNSVKKFEVSPGKKVKLKDFSTKCKDKILTKKEAQKMLDVSRKQLAEIQDKLYAHDKYGVLIVLQAMDAAGKDSAIKHIMTGFNPQGVKIYSFKAPSSTELDHHYLWRHQIILPARGEIAIFNRSHYENVLVTKVHPEWILNEKIPDVDAVKKINNSFWENRYKQIRRFEEALVQNGTIVLKFFLHLSKKEQKKRFIERIDDPSKNWKFSLGDLKERKHWDDYQKAYEQAITETATDYAPWFIIPADDKWYTRLFMAEIILKKLSKLGIDYPTMDSLQNKELQNAKAQLLAEESNAKKK